MPGRLTLRDKPRFASGSAVIQPSLRVLSVDLAEDVTHRGGLTIEASRTDPGVNAAVAGRVLVLEARGGVREFVVSGRDESLESDVVSISADPIHVAIHDAGIVDWRDPDGVAHVNLGGPDSGMSLRNFWFTFLRPSLRRDSVDWVELGSVDADERLIHSWEAESAQAVIVALARYQGAEWRLRLDEANARYLLDVGDNLGADATPAWAAEGLNLLTLSRAFDREELATVVRPVGTLASGAPADVSLALWRVGARAGNVIDLVPHADVGGDGPVLEDGQWVGSYLEDTDGDAHEITASSRADQSVTVAAGGGDFAVDDEVRLVADADSSPIVEVSSPDGLEAFGRIALASRLPFLSRSVAELASLLEWADAQDRLRGRTGAGVVFDGVGLGIEAGDTLAKAYSFTRTAYVQSVSELSGDTFVTADRTFSDNQPSIVCSPGIPDGWAFVNDTGGPPMIWRRAVDLSGTISGLTQSDTNPWDAASDGVFEVSGFSEGDRIEPGDLMHKNVSSSIWVADRFVAPSSGELDIFGINAGSITTIGWAGSQTIYRPTLQTLFDHVPVLLSSYRGRATEIDLPETTLAPAEGASIFARLRFVAMASASWSSGWQTLPRLQIVQGSTVVAESETTNWTPTGPGQQVSRTIELGPVDIDASASYKLRIRPGFAGIAANGQTNRFAMYVEEAILFVGLELPTEGSALIPEAAVGIQLGNRELERRRRWRARYRCALSELAEVLQLSPEAVRTKVGQNIRIRAPAMGVDGRFRITGLSWSPLSEQTEVELDSVGYFLASPGAEAESLFVRETGQRVSRAPPATGFYRAAEVSETQLSADDPITVGLVS